GRDLVRRTVAEDAGAAHRRIDAHEIGAEAEPLAELGGARFADQERIGPRFEEHPVNAFAADETAGATSRLQHQDRRRLAARRGELADPVGSGEPGDPATDHGEADRLDLHARASGPGIQLEASRAIPMTASTHESAALR